MPAIRLRLTHRLSIRPIIYGALLTLIILRRLYRIDWDTRCTVIESGKNSQTWFWANLPAGHQEVAIGITAERISVQPVSAILISVILGLLMAMLVAQALAKRVTAPLAKFDNAVVQLGKGRFLKLQPDKWPSELQDLADRFNAMSAQIDQLMTARTTLSCRNFSRSPHTEGTPDMLLALVTC